MKVPTAPPRAPKKGSSAESEARGISAVSKARSPTHSPISQQLKAA
jgi:hypothetical protein